MRQLFSVQFDFYQAADLVTFIINLAKVLSLEVLQVSLGTRSNFNCN